MNVFLKFSLNHFPYSFSCRVSMKSHRNKMSIFNLGVVFGPTLLRAVEETLAAILDIKFNNVVIEILIENFDLIFKNPPGKPSDNMLHSNPPDPVPRTYGSSGYRTNRNSLTTQPVVRVVTRSIRLDGDTVMSSSLQNIPNGMHNPIYQNSSGKSSKNYHPIYDIKQNTMNQSTPSLNRDINLSPRDMTLSRDTTYATSPTKSHNISPNHRVAELNKTHSNHGNSRDKLLHNRVVAETNLGRDTNMTTMTRSSGDGIYVQSQRINPMNYSESNLVHPSSVIDRINSTSSSNESVCSSSSLNHSYSRHAPPPSAIKFGDYNSGGGGGGGGGGGVGNNFVLRDEPSQPYMPKKTQRSKDVSAHRFNSPRDNV